MTTEHHSKDSDCTLDEHGLCIDCGVGHGDPCDECGGRGFHTDDCSEVKDIQDHGLHAAWNAHLDAARRREEMPQ